MLRSCTSTILSSKLTQILPVQYQTLRWKRKPRKPFWLGTAKSKIFRVNDHPILPPEEAKELLRLHANYKAALKSIRHYFMSEESKQIDTMEGAVQLATPEEIEASYKMNDEWNAECARVREERLTQSDLEHEELVMNVIASKEAKMSLLQERVDEMVRIEKAKSKDFITRENLDAKIEECLASIQDFNFAIDLQGNKYTGEDMKPLSEAGNPVTPPQVSTSTTATTP